MMVWVVVILLVILIVAAINPRLVGLIFIGIILLIVAFFNKNSEAKKEAQKHLDKMHLTVEYNVERCSSGYPIRVLLSNQSTKTISEFKFTLTAKAKGYSDIVYRSFIRSDKIIEANTAFSTCYSISSSSDRVVHGQTPDKWTWSFQDARVDF